MTEIYRDIPADHERNIFGSYDAYLKKIERVFRVDITERNGSVKISGEEATLSVTIHEGRNRQIRRLCERAGLKVLCLRRMKEGPVSLGSLRSGEWRDLTDGEVKALRESAGGGEA